HTAGAEQKMYCAFCSVTNIMPCRGCTTYSTPFEIQRGYKDADITFETTTNDGCTTSRRPGAADRERGTLRDRYVYWLRSLYESLSSSSLGNGKHCGFESCYRF